MAPADAAEEEPGRAEEEPTRAVEGPMATVQRAAKRAAPAALVPAFDNNEIQDTPRLRKVKLLAWHKLLPHTLPASCQRSASVWHVVLM